MNQTNQPNDSQPFGGDSFPSQPASQTNPFTADLKGEFTSNFGTNTNAVSQIFRDGGFSAGGNGKWIILGVVLVALLVGGFFLLSGGKNENDELANISDSEELPLDGEESELSGDGVADAEAAAPEEQVAAVEQVAPVAEAAPVAEVASQVGSGTIALLSPVDGAIRAYDETSGPAIFEWDGGVGTIKFSRSRSMNPVYMKVPVSGNSYSFYNPYPGNWFWQVESQEGSSEVRRFKVDPAPRRNLIITEPGPGASLAASGGQVSWQGDSKVAFYRVEFSSDGTWANPKRFASSGMALQVSDMQPGMYSMRLGGFSEVSGHWEYSQPIAVNVQ